MPRKKPALGRDPFDLVMPAQDGPASREGRKSQASPDGRGSRGGPQTAEQRKRDRKLNAYVAPETRERLKRAAYWERTHQAEIVERAITRELDRLEKQRGKPYPPQPE